jgi:ribosomal-protein-alanine N-acetyltransferase
MDSLPPVRFLVGERVYLRAVEENDVPRLQQWINHPEIRRWLLVVRPMDLKAESAWFDSLDRGPLPRSITFAIALLADDRLIGTTALHLIDWVHRVGETGSMIGDRSLWGKGYGTESKQLLLRYCFDTLGLNRMESHTFEDNARSARHLEKCGYQVEGRFRQRIFRDGRYWDTVHYGLLANEWRAANPSPDQ